MLTVSKPTLFGPDGMAARGQCSHDSPGWQLRWFEREQAPVLIWQGAYKTCRHLQTSCATAASLVEVQGLIGDLLNANAPANFASMPTDVYPAAEREDNARKKKKKKRH